MAGLLSNVDPDGLLEYSVVFTDRSLNHMSASFQNVMKDISGMLKEVYNAKSAVLVPGGGTYGMEAVARQFATDKKCLIVRNGLFSFRWTQIFDAGNIPAESTVLKARRVDDSKHAAFVPAPIEEVVATIQENKPDIVIIPHVETSSGMIMPKEYIRAAADAVHAVGGMFILDCVASGAIWVDMPAYGVDVLISAPQKGWSGSPGCGLVMLSELARERITSTASTSFSCDLLKWLQIMETYENGAFGYHATMPTDALKGFRDVMKEAEEFGFENMRVAQQELGDKVRAMLAGKGVHSVAAKGYEAPGVVVCYTDDDDIHNGKKFKELGLQIAAGCPLHCDEPKDFKTFRLGLFGLDKLGNVDRTVETLAEAVDKIC